MTISSDTVSHRLLVQQIAARELLEASSLEQAVAEILRALSVHFRWELAAYWVASPPETSGGPPALRCQAIWADESIVRAPFVEATRTAVLAPGEGGASPDPVRRAFLSGEPIWLEELPPPGPEADERMRLASAAGVGGATAFPLRRGERVSGVIELCGRGRRPVDEELLTLMADVGREIAEVLERQEAHAAALEAAERSRDELSVVLAALPDGVTVQDGKGRLIYANDAAASAAGFPSGEEMVRASAADVLRRFQMWDEGGNLLSAEDLPGRQALRGNRSERLLRYRHSSAPGRDRWVTIQAVPIKNGRGEVERVVNVMHDVTDRRRSEEWRRFLGDASTALGSSMELEPVLQSVAEIAARSVADCAAIAIRTKAREVRLAAFAAGEVLGGQVGDLRSVAQVCASEMVTTKGAPILIDAQEAGGAAQDGAGAPFHGRLTRTLAEQRVRSFMAVPLVSREEPLGAILLFGMAENRRYLPSDVAAAEELARRASITIDNVRLYDEAQEALRAREDLLAIVSHDLRNPLGVVLASSALLLRSALPPEKEERARRQVEAIQRAGNRMNRLIRDLLDFASIQGGRLSVNLRPQDASNIVREVLEALEPLAAPKSLRLVDESPPDLRVCCDHDRVIQLFSNVVGNAIKFTPEGGTITVQACPDGEQTRFTVIDTGPGIPAEELPHVFDRYYQSRRKNREGIGLGLSIAKGIVEAHNGRIWAESVEGQGSRFCFTLPAA